MQKHLIFSRQRSYCRVGAGLGLVLGLSHWTSLLIVYVHIYIEAQIIFGTFARGAFCNMREK